MKFRTIYLVALALLIAIAFAILVNYYPSKGQVSNGYVTITLHTENGKYLPIKAEIADSPEERADGLMFRKSLGKSEGMLFIFPDSAVRNFWMKNTLIQLDMIFIAENMTIVKIHHAVPCSSEPCPLYSSEKQVKYVLEVSGNLTVNYGIGEGSLAGFK